MEEKSCGKRKCSQKTPLLVATDLHSTVQSRGYLYRQSALKMEICVVTLVEGWNCPNFTSSNKRTGLKSHFPPSIPPKVWWAKGALWKHSKGHTFLLYAIEIIFLLYLLAHTICVWVHTSHGAHMEVRGQWGGRGESVSPSFHDVGLVYLTIRPFSSWARAHWSLFLLKG